MAVVLGTVTVWFDRIAGRFFYPLHRALYEWTNGFIGHRTPAGPMLLLTTVGRRTGQKRTHALLYMADGPDYVVVGSNGGRSQIPAWVLNLSATPEVGVQIGRQKLRAVARILTDEERTAMWPRLTAHYGGWDHYQQLTVRQLKVVSLAPSR